MDICKYLISYYLIDLIYIIIYRLNLILHYKFIYYHYDLNVLKMNSFVNFMKFMYVLYFSFHMNFFSIVVIEISLV